MSFMKGFGQSFSASFEAGQERKARREDDLFKLKYADYINRRDKIEEREREGDKAVRLAKSLVQQTGAPEGAWVNAYEWLIAGQDQDSVMKALSGGSFEAIEQPASDPQSPQGPVDPNAPVAPVDKQTTQAIPPNPGVPMAGGNAAPEPKKSGWSNILPKLLGPSRPEEKVMGRMAEVTGQSPESIQATLDFKSGSSDIPASTFRFIPPEREGKPDPFADLKTASVELAQAQTAAERDPNPKTIERARVAQERIVALQNAIVFQARAEGKSGPIVGGQLVKVPGQGRVVEIRGEENGKFISSDGEEFARNDLRALTEFEEKELSDISKDIAPQQIEYNKKSEALIAGLRDFSEMSAIVEMTEGRVLAERTAGFAQGVQEWAADLKASVFALRGKDADPNKAIDETTLNNMEAEVDARIREAQQTGVFSRLDELGTARSLFEAKAQILSYRLAAMNQQEGRSLAETERAIFLQLSQAGNTPDKFNQNASSLINGAIRNLQTEETSLTKHNGRIQTFMNTYGWTKSPFPIATPIVERINEDEITRVGYEVLKKFDPMQGSLLNNKPNTPSPAPQPTPVTTPGEVRIPQRSIDLLKANPETAEQFDLKYGQGASARILQGQ